MKKKCGNCKRELDTGLFSKNATKKDGLQSICRECKRAYGRRHYQENKDKYLNRAGQHKENIKTWFKDLKSKLSCNRCGFNHPAVIDFHHLRDKKTTVSKAITDGWSKKKIEEEIDKCEVLCANCHRIHHYEENQQ